MEDEKDAFYVLRKGDIIGIYKSFSDCQAQAGFSPLDPSISVYKGYGLPKETETYLLSQGLRQADYSISACDVQGGLFGPLSVCPFQDVGGPSSSTLDPSNKSVKLENYVEPQAFVDSVRVPASNGKIQKHVSAESSSFTCDPPKRVSEQKNYMEPQQMVYPATQSCIIEFDGASKGNPGLAGAGAILRVKDGSQVWLLREGVGIATNNVAEYRSVILGLRMALQKGFKHVTVRGDSLLVVNQIQGKWKTKNENMANLCKDALLLKKQFLSFTIEQVPREFNSAADAQANRAIKLRDKQVEIEMSTSHA